METKKLVPYSVYLPVEQFDKLKLAAKDRKSFRDLVFFSAGWHFAAQPPPLRPHSVSGVIIAANHPGPPVDPRLVGNTEDSACLLTSLVLSPALPAVPA